MNKPTIAILTTGGTIAGRAASPEASTGYEAGALSGADLTAAVPELTAHAEVRTEEICAIDSKDMTDRIWLSLGRRVGEQQADPAVDGIVITHGTDTMEETAFFLSLTTRGEKPVVLTGAMRPATALSADGPMNLLNAVRLAASPASRGRGVVVTMDDEIFSAWDVTKADTLSLHTFRSFLGPLGRIAGGRVCWYREDGMRLPFFDASRLTALPRVEIIYGRGGADGALIRAVVDTLHPAGLVYAGTGNGSIHREDEAALAEAVEKGIPVVRASRAAGPVTRAEPSYETHHFLSAGPLSPQKSRLLLALSLACGKDPAEIFGALGKG